jgi:membrane-bound lytic murein transglycosylase D
MPWGQEEFEKTRAAYLTSGGKKWLAVVMAQAMPYLSYVEDKVEEYGLPKELAYLPVIESEYSPQAVSTSGATGLWQFMRNSITGYGLSISEWVDDRKDFMKSTDAALKKLRDNKEALNDWLLALAAYNAGLGAVSRAVKPSGGEKALDFWELYDSKKLSREPLSYIPKFLAVASILRYPELHGLPAEWGERGNWEAVETTRQVDMNVLSEKAGIPLGLLQAGNAELKYHITPPSASHKLKVPADKAETVRTILADDSTPLYKYDIYKVKSGDTLGEIAKGYGVALSLILQSNPGVKADRLKIGQTLIIPHIPGMAASVQPKASTAASSYTVRKGDTLWSIAVKFGMKADELAKANNFDVTDLLRVGQVLKLPKS